jgi:hypothetical protein
MTMAKFPRKVKDRYTNMSGMMTIMTDIRMTLRIMNLLISIHLLKPSKHTMPLISVLIQIRVTILAMSECLGTMVKLR